MIPPPRQGPQLLRGAGDDRSRSPAPARSNGPRAAAGRRGSIDQPRSQSRASDDLHQPRLLGRERPGHAVGQQMSGLTTDVSGEQLREIAKSSSFISSSWRSRVAWREGAGRAPSSSRPPMGIGSRNEPAATAAVASTGAHRPRSERDDRGGRQRQRQRRPANPTRSTWRPSRETPGAPRACTSPPAIAPDAPPPARPSPARPGPPLAIPVFGDIAGQPDEKRAGEQEEADDRWKRHDRVPRRANTGVLDREHPAMERDQLDRLFVVVRGDRQHTRSGPAGAPATASCRARPCSDAAQALTRLRSPDSPTPAGRRRAD